MTRPRLPLKGNRSSKSPYSVLDEFRATIKSGGGNKKFTAEEAAIHGVLLDAIAGDSSSIRMIGKIIRQREMPITRARRAITITYAHTNPRRADDALLLLGIATQLGDRQQEDNGGPYLQLEPWFVDHARARPNAPQLNEVNERSLRQNTRAEGG